MQRNCLELRLSQGYPDGVKLNYSVLCLALSLPKATNERHYYLLLASIFSQGTSGRHRIHGLSKPGAILEWKGSNTFHIPKYFHGDQDMVYMGGVRYNKTSSPVMCERAGGLFLEHKSYNPSLTFSMIVSLSSPAFNC